MTLPERTDDTDRSADATDPEQWVDRHGDAMYRYAMSKTGNASVAEELVQESFLAGLRSHREYRGDSTVSTWLFAILRRKIADYYRRRQRSGTAIEHAAEQTADEIPKGSLCRRWSGDPAAIFEADEFWQVFEQCVEKLPDKLAEVHQLREVKQQSPKDICQVLGISATNLSMRLHRSRLALRDCLQKNWFRDDRFE